MPDLTATPPLSHYELVKAWSEKATALGAKHAIVGTTPGLRDVEMRAKLIKEECDETLKALREGNAVEAIDGLCDLMFVTLGAFLAFGVHPDAPFREVARSNDTKLLDGVHVRADGKILKSPSFDPPRLAQFVAPAEDPGPCEKTENCQRPDGHPDDCAPEWSGK